MKHSRGVLLEGRENRTLHCMNRHFPSGKQGGAWAIAGSTCAAVPRSVFLGGGMSERKERDRNETKFQMIGATFSCLRKNQRPETSTVCSTTPPSALRLCGTAPRLPVYQPPNYYSYSRLKFLGPAPDCHNPTTKRSGTSHSIHQLPCNVQIKSQASSTTGTVITTEGIQ